jgi:hypothetical protein
MLRVVDPVPAVIVPAADVLPAAKKRRRPGSASNAALATPESVDVLTADPTIDPPVIVPLLVRLPVNLAVAIEISSAKISPFARMRNVG